MSSLIFFSIVIVMSAFAAMSCAEAPSCGLLQLEPCVTRHAVASLEGRCHFPADLFDDSGKYAARSQVK
jgi:hypothetical protein